MDQQNPQQQLLERLKTANNVLVTVSANPSVDQLAACIGLTLLLNKQGKHATAVFSGEVPSTLEFLQPGETLEKNTDSLRDFIISLDKSKADKLRYKVEDAVVKIFITPYRTSLSADDLEFSQGDFNVDLVVALGVKEQQDLDNAITAHGRILHDATVATVNTGPTGKLGSINWQDSQASSLCELVVDLARDLGKELMDNQIATALLTGIVAETARFSNEKTSPQTMSVSAELMAAGANQQLVASKLEDPSVDLHSSAPEPPAAAGNDAPDGGAAAPPAPSAAKDDGMLEISHPNRDEADATRPPEEPVDEIPAPEAEQSEEKASADTAAAAPSEEHSSKLITEPPQLGGQLTANTEPEGYDPTSDPLSLPNIEDAPMLTHDASAVTSEPEPVPEPTLADAWTPPTPVAPAIVEPHAQPGLPPAPQQVPAPAPEPPDAPSEPPAAPAAGQPDETLADLEKEVHSPHAGQPEAGADIDAARSEVLNALNSGPQPALPPIEALNAQPVDLGTHPADSKPQPVRDEQQQPAQDLSFDPTAFGVTVEPEVPGPSAPLDNVKFPLGKTMTMPLPPAPQAVPAPQQNQPAVTDPTAPPPVPPPLPFQFGGPQNQ